MKRFPTPIKYVVKNKEKYVGDSTNVISRSSWETKFMRWCDMNPSVELWGSEIQAIQYYSQADKKLRRYFPDFFIKVKMKDGSLKDIIIEIKPHDQTIPPVKGRKRQTTFINECITWQVNQDKWKAAIEWARLHNFTFQIMNEYDLGIKKRKQ